MSQVSGSQLLSTLAGEIGPVLSATQELDRSSSPTSLEDIESKLNLARCHIKTLRNSQHGINALAPEILGQIFVFLDSFPFQDIGTQEDLHQASLGKLQVIRTLIHVCRQWRSIAFTNPYLWNHLHLNRTLHPFASLSLTMSGSLPLTIYYSDGAEQPPGTTCPDTYDGVQTMSEHLHRLQKLVMFVQWPSDSLNWGCLNHEAPNLRTLQITRPDIYKENSDVLPLLFAGRHPKLQEVVLCLYSPSSETQFRNLRSLILHEQDDVREPRPGFCVFLPLIAESPQLEELIIDRQGSSSRTIPTPDQNSLDNPVSLPRLRTLGLGLSSSWRAETAEDVPHFLSCIRIPDSASRYLFTRDRVQWDISLYDLMNMGRLQPSRHRPIRRLQIVSNHDLEWWKAFALEGDTLTMTSNVDTSTRSTLIASGVLSDVEDLALIELPQHPSLQVYEALFESLPSLRHISLSGPTRGSILVPHVTNALGLRPSKYAAAYNGTIPAPLLESISFLYYDPNQLPQTEDDGVQVDGTMIALLAEERERRGSPLQRVLVERCKEDHLEWIQEHVASAVSIKRWEGYPGDYHEKVILKEMLAKVSIRV